MSFIGTAWARIPRGIQTIVIVAAVLFAGLLLWQFGARTSDRIGSWWFNRGVNQSQKELQESKALIGDLTKQLAAEKAKREALEKVLADKHLTSEQKLKAYEEAIKSSVPATPVGNTDELCARAAALGVPCQ